MTNRLLATVMAFAVSGGLLAHTAQDPRHALPTAQVSSLTLPRVSLRTIAAPSVSLNNITLTTPTSVPQAMQAAVNHVSDTATAAVDPSAALRAAFIRDHVALEHLRQQGSALKGRAHQAFNQRISASEAVLVETEKAALASRDRASTSIAVMDELVTSAKAALAQGLAQTGDEHSSDRNHQSQD